MRGDGILVVFHGKKVISQIAENNIDVSRFRKENKRNIFVTRTYKTKYIFKLFVEV